MAGRSDFGVVECSECNRIGAPEFHSTRCNPGHQPRWRALAGSSLFPLDFSLQDSTTRNNNNHQKSGGRLLVAHIFDPRSPNIKSLNRLIVLARGVSLAVDPLFLFSVSATGTDYPCIYMDGSVMVIASVLRTCVDAVHVIHLFLKFRLAYVSKESMVIGNGKLVWDSRSIVNNYLGSIKGFWFDALVILPIPQIVYWCLLPKLVRGEKIETVITIAQFIFLLQFFPKLYHSFYLMRGVRKVTGYIFGTVWWGFTLNLIAYFLASHISGGYWYILTIQRIAECLTQQCRQSNQCNRSSLSCPREICYSSFKYSCNANSNMKANFSICLQEDGDYPFGIYAQGLPAIAKNSNIVQILFANLWGIMGISTMGNNLEPSNQTLELIFTILMVLAGLSLFTLLIGNIQVFLHAVTARRRKMQLRYRDMEWWMRRRQLPSSLRRRVRHYEHQRWTTMGGQDEMELIKDLPDGLRRDIKRYLCLDLVKKVPLFHHLDDLILDHICDRVKPMIFSRNEKIVKEGEPVQRMVFIVSGTVERSQTITKGMVTTTLIESGGFLGDELLSWCLRRPSSDRFPVSSATFTCVDQIEAYGLDYDHLLYITDHFRYTFSKGDLKNKTRYYSSNWRSWAAVNIQFAWRRYLQRTRGGSGNRGNCNDGGSTSGGGRRGDQKLRHYAAMFMSLRPHDHLE